MGVDGKGIPWLSLFGHRADRGRRNDASIDRHRGALVLSSELCPECPSPCPCCVAWENTSENTSEHEVVLVGGHQLPKCLAVRDIYFHSELHTRSRCPIFLHPMKYGGTGSGRPVVPGCFASIIHAPPQILATIQTSAKPTRGKAGPYAPFPTFFRKRESSPKRPRNRGFVWTKHEV